MIENKMSKFKTTDKGQIHGSNIPGKRNALNCRRTFHKLVFNGQVFNRTSF